MPVVPQCPVCKLRSRTLCSGRDTLGYKPKSRRGHVAVLYRTTANESSCLHSFIRTEGALARTGSISAQNPNRAGSIQKAAGMLGNLFRQKTGVVLRRRAGDWHMYVIGAFAGVIGGFYIWLEPLRQLQLEGIRKAKEEEKK